VIKDKTTVVDIIRIDELLIIDWVTIHFGKNSKFKHFCLHDFSLRF
jgi:hypothetical protein